MLRILVLIVILISLTTEASADTLKPFTTDGCSSFPDGTSKQKTLWLHCCQRHDFDYWQGGTYQQRLESDKRLEVCVVKVGQPKIAALMYAGVRVGGSPYFPSSFRWGYGWSYPRAYGALTEQEQLASC